MPVTEHLGRRNCIPIIYARGTHYEVGFDVGRTFSGMIQNYVSKNGSLNNDYLPTYETVEGRKVYDETLAVTKVNFPQYVAEVQGTADGSGVPFHKLFLLQMDDITTNVAKAIQINNKPTGCSTVCINEANNEILGHTEDALAEVLNNFYILNAHITTERPEGKWKVQEERFTSLCYAGHLPGYTMGFNNHGLVYSINTLSAQVLYSKKTPRTFITRALLTAKDQLSVERILTDEGCGAADGFSVNLTFLEHEGDRLFMNIEVAPAPAQQRSQLCVLAASPGEHLFHCNSYLRLKTPETGGLIIDSSTARMGALKKHGTPSTREHVEEMLSDQTGEDFRVFQDFGPDDYVKTVAVGIFDLCQKTWSLYVDKPSKCEPLVVLPLTAVINTIKPKKSAKSAKIEPKKCGC